ncbi:hypothetical protein BOX15_Mlig033463g2 [Macrostomum lignano]|uniref:Dolichyldiphosphatase n=1 Tax=Macrostomum lignano TaxID=282301 RepID=A0A267GKU6_9PLAT|nr:hypothetical protein BOX15_Mlig033463g2 [Macrostomum lignano]
MTIEHTWKPVTLLLVEYPVGDHLGLALAWLSFFPIFFIIGCLSIVLLRRDLHTITFLAGIFINEGINLIIKKYLKHPRPVMDPGRYKLSSYGMPSDHAQATSFIVTYLCLFVLLRLYRNASLLEDLWKYILCCCLVGIGGGVAFSRVYLGYHTWSQVGCGSLLGVLAGLAWFLLVHWHLSNYFSLLANSPIGNQLLLRDCSTIPNVLYFEYVHIKKESTHRQRRKGSC